MPTPVANETAARCQIWVASVSESTATSVMPVSSTVATPSRISFCGTRSATTPPRRAGSSTPTALAVVTTDSWPGPPPMRITSHTSATIQTPEAKLLRTSASASRR